MIINNKINLVIDGYYGGQLINISEIIIWNEENDK